MKRSSRNFSNVPIHEFLCVNIKLLFSAIVRRDFPSYKNFIPLCFAIKGRRVETEIYSEIEIKARAR